MEVKDYYSLREIVLGLREEYLKFYEEIEKLKSLCTVDERKVKDFDFRTKHFTAKKEEKLPEFYCIYEERLNVIQAYFRYIKSRILCFPDNNMRIGRLALENGSFNIKSCYDYFPIQIIGEKENAEFYEQANAILNSEFANNIDFHSWYNAYIADKERIPIPKNIAGEFHDSSIDAFSAWFKITMHMNNSDLKAFWLNYKPDKDSLELAAFGKDGKHKLND